MELLKKGMTDVLVAGGGIIPDADKEKLNDLGVGKLFAPLALTPMKLFSTLTNGLNKTEKTKDSCSFGFENG